VQLGIECWSPETGFRLSEYGERRLPVRRSHRTTTSYECTRPSSLQNRWVDETYTSIAHATCRQITPTFCYSCISMYITHCSERINSGPETDASYRSASKEAIFSAQLRAKNWIVDLCLVLCSARVTQCTRTQAHTQPGTARCAQRPTPTPSADRATANSEHIT
jgi:hypothetical protein